MLHTGSELEQAGSTEQGCKDDGVRRGSEERRKIPANNAIAGLLDLYRTLIWIVTVGHTFRKYFGMYGGDDGARTRDLCRDRAAL